MHEWALAEAVIASAIEESRKEGLKKITEIRLKIGELQQMDTEILKFALSEIGREHGELLKHVKTVMVSEPAIFRCRLCGNEWDFAATGLNEDEGEAVHFAPEVAHVYVRCLSCKSPDFEMIQGRGVLIEEIKGVV